MLAVAAAAGLDTEEVGQMLGSNRYCDAVNDSLQWCAQAGISGVPFFRLEDGEVIHGAQPVPVFQMLLESASA